MKVDERGRREKPHRRAADVGHRLVAGSHDQPRDTCNGAIEFLVADLRPPRHSSELSVVGIELKRALKLPLCFGLIARAIRSQPG